MNNDYGWAAGFGIGMVLIMIVLYAGIFALSIWITYLIIRTAVKNGILKADEERIQRGYSVAPQPRGYSNPPGMYPPRQ